MLLPILPSMVSTELVSNFLLVARAQTCVHKLCCCAVLWFARSKDQVSLGGRLVFNVHLLWPVLLKGWQERSADVAAPICSQDLGCPCMSQASLSSSVPSTAQQELGVDARSTGCIGLWGASWLVGS